MKNIIGILAFLILGLVFQTAVVPHLIEMTIYLTGMGFLEFHTVDFALIVLAYLAWNRPRTSALVWAIVIGFMISIFGVSWFNVALASYFVSALIVSFLNRHFLLKGVGGIAGLVFFFSLLEAIAHAQFAYLFYRISAFDSQVGFVFIQALINGLAALIIVPLFTVFDELTFEAKRSDRNKILLPI